MLELFKPGEYPNFKVKDFGIEPIDIWSVEIIPRSEWGALPPKADIEAMPLPVKNIGFWGTEDDDTGIPGVCTSQEDCVKTIFELQKRHMDEGLPDIKYNFLIGDDGNIYEGRGWEKRPAVYWDESKKFKQMNKNMLEIGYIGINDMKFLHYEMYETFQKLVGQGVAKKYIQEDHRMWDLFSEKDDEEEE